MEDAKDEWSRKDSTVQSRGCTESLGWRERDIHKSSHIKTLLEVKANCVIAHDMEEGDRINNEKAN